MFKLFLLIPLWIGNLYAWDYNIYTLFQHSTSNNYYQATTANEHDTFNTMTGTIQMSNQRNIVYVQYSSQQYANINANDNYSTNLTWTYHQTKKHDYTLSIFGQKYLQPPTNVTDTSSNNIGGKIVSTWTTTYSNVQSGYLNLGFTYTDYYKDATRQDQSIDLSVGLQRYLGGNLSLIPSFATNYLASKNSYYQYFSAGPALYLSYYPNDKIVFYVSGSYLYTSYAYRTFTLTSITGKAVTTSEKQTLMTTDIGTIYSLTKNIPLQLSYATTKNTSNYSYRDYKTSIFSISIGVNL